MKQHFYKIFLISAVAIFINGCGNKMIQIQDTKPAAISKAMNYKNLTVLKFKGDQYGITNILEQKLNDKKFRGKKLFNIVSRNEMPEILKEQKFSNTGIINKKDRIELGKIKGIDALIVGSVNNENIRDTYFYKTRLECANKECTKTYKVRVNCTNRTYSTNISIKMIDVKTSNIVVTKTYPNSYTTQVCEDSYNSYPNSDTILYNLEKQTINSFLKEITPHKYNSRVVLVDEEPELDLNSKEEKIKEEAISALENRYYKKAENKFKELLTKTNYRSYVATYNLALIKEIQGNYEEALALLKRATYIVKDLSDTPELNSAIYRIEIKQKNREKLEAQLEAHKTKNS